MLFSLFQPPSSYHPNHLIKKIRNAHLHISLSRNENGHFKRFPNRKNGERTVPKKISRMATENKFIFAFLPTAASRKFRETSKWAFLFFAYRRTHFFTHTRISKKKMCVSGHYMCFSFFQSTANGVCISAHFVTLKFVTERKCTLVFSFCPYSNKFGLRYS